jgi:hypothetical protein
MKRGIAVTLILAAAPLALAASGAALAQQQMPPQCATFPQLSAEAQKRGETVSAAIKAKADPKQICGLMNTFVAAESAVVKFLVDNQTWCGVPPQAVASSKANHEKSLKFRTMVCNNDAPRQKAPSLSDAIKTSPLDTAKNTKTGTGGTFDTLTGNPLAR